MSLEDALLIIDMQNDFVLPSSPFHIKGATATLPNIVRVRSQFRKQRRPIFHVVREYRADGADIERFRLAEFERVGGYAVPGTAGCRIVDELTPLDGEYRIVKNRFSAFMNTELDFMLRGLRVCGLTVVGTQYPNCIRATVFDAVALGYSVTVVTDATSAMSDEIARANIVDLRNVGVRCLTTGEFLDSLEG